MTTLTFAEIKERAGARWWGTGTDEMFEVVIHDPHSPADPVRARVVPTRMHAPGFYVASPGSTPLFAMWMMRSDEDLEMFERFCGLGWVTSV